jgi:hypothetical protein
MHSSMLERLITADFTVAGFMEAFMAEVMGDGDKELEPACRSWQSGPDWVKPGAGSKNRDLRKRRGCRRQE